MFRIKDRVAVVTGAASGIGKAIATELTKRGAGVLLVDSNDAVAKVAEDLDQWALVGDACDDVIQRFAFDAAERRFHKPATICIPAAGITRDGFAARLPKESTRAETLSQDKIQDVLNVNLAAPMGFASHFCARLLEKGRAHKLSEGEEWNGIMVFIGSISSEGNAGQMNYAATKAGLRAVVNTLNQEWNKRNGMKAYIVHPGFTATPMTSTMRSDILEAALRMTESGSLFAPEYVAETVCRLIEENLPAVPPEATELFIDRFSHAATFPAPVYLHSLTQAALRQA